MTDGVIVNLFEFPFMQLYYLIQLLFMQLSHIIEYVYPYFHGLVVVTRSCIDVASTWIGRVCIVVMMLFTICRLSVEGMLSTPRQADGLSLEWNGYKAFVLLRWNGMEEG